MTLYITASLILIIILLLYFRIADHFNIIDKPNQRSSHIDITIRGGGIIFPVAALLWFLMFGFYQPWVIFALLALSTVSFLDDVITLSNKIRIIIHIAAVSILFWQLQIFELPWYFVIIIYIFTIGWINAFNFMDGINGITSFYSLVGFGTILWLYNHLPLPGFDNLSSLIIILIISLIIFSFFNARKRAKTFAGDVGSVSLAFLLAWFIIKLIVETGRIEYILFVSLYGIDSVVTIIYRLKRKENIFKAHRTHLYQYLSNEYGLPHLLVSAFYAFVQLSINIITIYLIKIDIMSIGLFAFMLILLSFVYLIIRYVVSIKLSSMSKSNSSIS